MRIETARLILRPLTSADAEALVALDAHPEVRRWLDMAEGATREQALAWLEKLSTLRERAPGMDFWGLEEKESGLLLGWVHLKPLALSRSAMLHPELVTDPEEWEIGWRLRRESWGEGYASEAARELARRALSDWAAPSLCAVALVGNDASFRVMKKCGLAFEKEFLYDGRLPAQKWSRVR